MTRHLGIDGYLILSILASAPDREWYGHELAKRVGASHGLVSRLLERLRDQGWLADRWEDSTSSAAGRQPRHYYRLQASVLPEVQRLLQDAGRRVVPLTRWVSSSGAPHTAVVSPPGPSALSTEEIATSIASYVAELRRRAARAHDDQDDNGMSGNAGCGDVARGVVPEPRAS